MLVYSVTDKDSLNNLKLTFNSDTRFERKKPEDE